jgi:hypothetical protein
MLRLWLLTRLVLLVTAICWLMEIFMFGLVLLGLMLETFKDPKVHRAQQV